MSKQKQKKLEKRKKRVRSKVYGSSGKPRLSVFRSNEHIYAQIVNDEKGETLISVSDMEVKLEKKKGITKAVEKKNEKTKVSSNNSTLQDRSKKMEKAYRVGELVAKKSVKKKIKKVVFDRGGYKYHGRVAALAEGARKGGLEF